MVMTGCSKNGGVSAGLENIFIFRTFEKLSYALVMQTRLPVQLLDSALTP